MTASATHAAIKSRIETLALSFTPIIPVAWPNKDYQPTGERFLQVAIGPAPNQRMTLDVEGAGFPIRRDTSTGRMRYWMDRKTAKRAAMYLRDVRRAYLAKVAA